MTMTIAAIDDAVESYTYRLILLDEIKQMENTLAELNRTAGKYTLMRLAKKHHVSPGSIRKQVMKRRNKT